MALFLPQVQTQLETPEHPATVLVQAVCLYNCCRACIRKERCQHYTCITVAICSAALKIILHVAEHAKRRGGYSRMRYCSLRAFPSTGTAQVCSGFRAFVKHCHCRLRRHESAVGWRRDQQHRPAPGSACWVAAQELQQRTSHLKLLPSSWYLRQGPLLRQNLIDLSCSWPLAVCSIAL